MTAWGKRLWEDIVPFILFVLMILVMVFMVIRAIVLCPDTWTAVM